jgi:[acyl-carrier-protein] S-malonyltransferase
MSIACVFPGQGSQSIGMLSAYAGCDEVKHAVEIASSVLNENYTSMIEQGSAEQLAQTIHTQPVLLAMGVGVFRAFQSRHPDIRFHALAGHSLGEYSALVAANALSYESALTLVRRRAEYMQSAVPEGTGAMAAVLGLSDEQVDSLCSQIAKPDHWVQAANYNSPGQVVIAGHTAAVQEAMTALKAAGAKRVLILPVSVPSHTLLMREAAERFAKDLSATTIQSPDIPVWHNATLGTESNPDKIREALAQQLYAPVRWTSLVQNLAKQNIQHIVECGPGKVLVGLNKRAVDGLSHSSLHDAASIQQWSLPSLDKEPSL